MIEDLITDDLLLKNKKIINNLEIILINGYIYRGDLHTHTTRLLYKPRFFGSYESCIKYFKYVKSTFYIKKYKTLSDVKLLNLSLNEDNKKKVINLFKNVLFPVLKNKYSYIPENILQIEIKISFILLQIFFGFIPNFYYNLDLLDLTPEFIINYFKKLSLKQSYLDFLLLLITEYKNDKSILPSRSTFDYFDKLLIKKLYFLLKPLDIDGCCYVENNNYNQNNLCNIIADKLEIKSLCPPTELCIFNPIKFVKFVKIYPLNNDIN